MSAKISLYLTESNNCMCSCFRDFFDMIENSACSCVSSLVTVTYKKKLLLNLSTPLHLRFKKRLLSFVLNKGFLR